ncbi:MAG TPA: hypothetical protein VGH19_07850 [Verrucomicrobiae bacterium]
MDWQQPIALMIVASTAGVFLWQWLRPKRLGHKKGTVCGCSTNSVSAPKPTVIYHARKGERPQITVKMN